MEDQIKQHPIWTTLQQFSAQKGDNAFVERATDAQVAWYSQRIFQFVTLVEQRLKRSPATLLSQPQLSQLQGVLAGASAEVGNFLSNFNVAHLANAANVIDSQGFILLSVIPFGTPDESAVDLGEIADSFRNQTQGVLKTLFDDRDRFRSDFGKQVQEISQQSARIQELTETVAKQKADAITTVQALQTAYASKEQEFSKVFDSSIADQAATHAAMLTKFDTAAEEHSKVVATDSAKLLRDLESRLEEATKIVRIIGNIGVTGNYQKTAEIERDTANNWRLITLGIFVAAGSIGGYALFTAHEVGLPLTIARMLFSLLVLGATVYTGKESARHRTIADRAKRVELELASLGPFIESLPVDQQYSLRSKLTEQYFGKEAEQHSVSSPIDSAQIVDLLKTAIQQMRK